LIKYLKKKISSGHFLRKLYIIYRYYFFIKKKLQTQLFDENVKYEKIKKKTILFTLIETSHYINFFLLLLAKILKIRGYQVLVLVCDQFLHGCEIKSIKNIKDRNPCFNCKFNQKKIYPFFKIPILQLSDLYNKQIKSKVNAIVKRYKNNNYIFDRGDKFFYLNITIEDSVTRFFHGNVDQEKFKSKIDEVRVRHCFTAIFIHEISRVLDLKYKPVAVVSGMSSYSSWYPFYYYFKKSRNRFRLITLTQYNLKALVFNLFELFPASSRFKKFLNFRKNKNITKVENAIILKFIKDRFDGSSNLFKIDSYFGKKKKNLIEIKTLLNINNNKKNIFLFTNIFWDVGLSDRSLFFNSMLQWLFYTIDLLKNNPNYHIYIKPHPGEFKSTESLIGIEEIVKNKYKNSISNITFIKADYKIKAYDLKSFIDLALVYNGTLNIEFMILNVPVISCGLSPVTGMGLNKEIINITEYKKAIINENYNFSNFKVKNYKKLMLFAYFYFIKNSIPWNYTTYAYSENFIGFNFKSIDILNKNDPIISHWIKCITKTDKFIPESWEINKI
jgi:hypothetical protein